MILSTRRGALQQGVNIQCRLTGYVPGNYSISLWKEQIELIANRHGLITFITHPDYLIEGRARNVYTDLLTHLDRLRTTNNLWFALPRDVDRWWRHRSRMELTHDGERWCIAGPDSRPNGLQCHSARGCQFADFCQRPLQIAMDVV